LLIWRAIPVEENNVFISKETQGAVDPLVSDIHFLLVVLSGRMIFIKPKKKKIANVMFMQGGRYLVLALLREGRASDQRDLAGSVIILETRPRLEATHLGRTMPSFATLRISSRIHSSHITHPAVLVLHATSWALDRVHIYSLSLPSSESIKSSQVSHHAHATCIQSNLSSSSEPPQM